MLLLAGTCHAQFDPYGYVGAGIGIYDHAVKIPNQGVAFTISDRTTASKLFGGWRINENMAVEASYGKSGELRWSDSISVPNTTGVFGPDSPVTLDSVVRTEWTTTTISLMGHLERFFGGFGWYSLDGNFTFNTICSCGPGDFDVADETSSTDVFFTIGAEWNFARWAIRGQYELYDTEGDSQDVIYVGASFRF